MPISSEAIKLGRTTIGILDRDARTYRIKRVFPNDVARAYDAYGVDAGTIDFLRGLGVDRVLIEERRGQGRREYDTPLQDWLDGPEAALGTRGLPHRFLALSDLPKPTILEAEPCGKRLSCCSGRCRAPVRHWATTPHDCPTHGPAARP